jgi:transposase
MKYSTFVGLDVHKETIAVATIHDGTKEAEFLGTIPNNPDAIRNLVKKLGAKETYYCYEAGPCGFTIYRQLTELGANCLLAAPSLIPTKPGDKVKTDRKDAKKLARLLRNGDLTAVHVPSRKQEALRDLLRAREEANKDLKRKKNQLTKLLLRYDVHPPDKVKPWSVRYWKWLYTVRFEEIPLQIVWTEFIHAVQQAEEKVLRFDKAIEEAAEHIAEQKLFKAYQSLKGIGLLTAAVLVAEIGDITRFKSPKQLMAYIGLIPGEHSSGDTRKQGRITKTGNSHLRYMIVENSWHYRHKPRVGPELQKRQEAQTKEVKAIAWKAQHRLHHKYRKMVARGKSNKTAVVAVARELTGFIWAIGHQTDKERFVA